MSAAQAEFNELVRDKEKPAGHPEDREDAHSFLNLSDSENENTPPATGRDSDDERPISSFNKNQSRTTIPLTRYEANTGPKGVIADAQNFRDSRRQHRSSAHPAYNTSFNRPTGRLEQEALSFSEKVEDSDELDEDELDGDDDFMQNWRKSRMQELKSGGQDSGKAFGGHKKKRMWGGLNTVDGNGFLNAVDHSPQDVVVIVYIYDDESEVSVYIEECIRALAQKHLDVRFIKLHFEDAEMEPAGVPALLAYRAGDKFAGLVPIVEEIPDDAELSSSTLEVVLKRHQILR